MKTLQEIDLQFYADVAAKEFHFINEFADVMRRKGWKYFDELESPTPSKVAGILSTLRWEVANLIAKKDPNNDFHCHASTGRVSLVLLYYANTGTITTILSMEV